MGENKVNCVWCKKEDPCTCTNSRPLIIAKSGISEKYICEKDQSLGCTYQQEGRVYYKLGYIE